MIIEGFTDMSKNDIKSIYQKTENAFNVAVNRMIKALDNPNLKYKDEFGAIWIKAEGVEWLHNYFDTPTDLSTEPIIVRMEERIKFLEQQLEEKDKLLAEAKEREENIGNTIAAAFKAQEELIIKNYDNKLLLVQKDAENAQNELKHANDILEIEKNNLKSELDRFKPSVFGLYKKK